MAGAQSTTIERGSPHSFFVAYLDHLTRKGRDPKTIARYRNSFDRVTRWLDDVDVEPAQASERTLEEYVAWLASTVAPLTANRETIHVKSAFRYAARNGTIPETPARNLEAPPIPHVEPEVYSHAELQRIREAIRTPLDELIFTGLAYTGLRRHELVALTWNAVDFEHRFFTVRGKGGKLRRVPLHPAFASLLQTRPRCVSGTGAILGTGGSLRNVNWRLANLLERAHVDGGNRPAHRFRKTVATVLYEEGIRTDFIDRIMGWAPITVRQRYYTRIGDEKLYEAMLKLYPADRVA